MGETEAGVRLWRGRGLGGLSFERREQGVRLNGERWGLGVRVVLERERWVRVCGRGRVWQGVRLCGGT